MSMDAKSIQEVEDFTLQQYLEQIAQTRGSDGQGSTPRGGKSDTLDRLLKLSKEYQENIASAISKKASGHSRSNIDWEVGFFQLLESAAVYLRDESKVNAAAEAYRAQETEKAFGLLRDSYADINKVAEQWGAKFILLCDLTEAGGLWKSGPYCGAFYSANSPFIGVTFKGTNPTAINQWLVSANFTPKAQPNLWGTQVSAGAWNGLFQIGGGGYNQLKSGLAALLTKVFNNQTSVLTHVTGHSLGGSYSTLCYAALLADSETPGSLPSKLAVHDLFNFASPRIGLGDFAYKVQRVVAAPDKGCTWRIVNNTDPIPKVPPVKILAEGYPFVHIDDGMKIYSDKKPTLMPSEIGPSPPGPGPIPLDWSDHKMAAYTAALVYAMTGKPLPPHLKALSEILVDEDWDLEEETQRALNESGRDV